MGTDSAYEGAADSATGATQAQRAQSAERLKAFADAVVAIAMTLLILPLVESVADAGHEHMMTMQWMTEYDGQIGSFLLSFVLIAAAWRDHHQLFDAVDSVPSVLVWLSVVWMLTIVWLPVPTAMLGSIEPDVLQKVLYIGTLLVTRIAMLVSRIYLMRHPALHHTLGDRLRSGTVANAIHAGLMVVILIVAIAIPGWLGYFTLAGLSLIGPIHSVVWRRMQGR